MILETALKRRDLARLLRNCQDERDSAALYEALSRIERNPRLREVFRGLGESERGHCAYWEERLRSQGLEVPPFRPSLRTRTMIGLAKRLGVGLVLPRITTRELADHGRYANQEDANAAGLTSMAWKRRELVLVYQAEGLAQEEAQRAADRAIAQDPDAIDRLIYEERVMAAANLGNSPGSAAALSFALFAAGAFVPLVPFLFAQSAGAVIASIGCALLALLVLGVMTSFFNGRSPLFSGLRQVTIGAAAAAVTYLAGRLVAGAVG